MFSRMGALIASLMVFFAMFALFSNVLFIFPTYMSLVFDTYTLATAASHDNYLDYSFSNKVREKVVTSPLAINGYIDPHTVKIECYRMGESGGHSLVRKSTDSIDGFIRNIALQRGDKFKVKMSYDFKVRIELPGSYREFSVPLKDEKICFAEKFYSVKL